MFLNFLFNFGSYDVGLCDIGMLPANKKERSQN